MLGTQLSDEAVMGIIKQVDENDDGEIQFEEFCNLMRSMNFGKGGDA